LAACLFASVCATVQPAGGKLPTTEAGIRDSFGVPADWKIQYQDESGAAITAAQFEARAGKNTSVALIKNPEKHTFTMKLEKPGAGAVAKPVTSLPPLDFHDIAGRPVSNQTLAGKPTLLSFFFAECVPCIKEVPILNAFRRKHPEYN